MAVERGQVVTARNNAIIAFSMGKGGAVRLFLTVTMIVACTSILLACGGTAQQQSSSSDDGLKNITSIFDPELAAQRNYDRALTDFQNCIAENPNNVDACDGQRQIMEADVKVLAAALGKH
jgi:hypothetical protein